MKMNSPKLCGIFAVCLLAAASVLAQDAALLTRAQWLKQIGAAVNDVAVLKNTLARVAPDDRAEFTRRILKAVSRMPVGPEEKAAAFVRAAVACISGITGEVKLRVIAEVFAMIPIEYLPVVTEELAKRFNQDLNGLSDDQYEKIASETLKIVIERNAQLDMPSVRNTFVILAFLKGARNPDFGNVLIALLPDERMRNLASGWVRSVVDGKDYEPLLAAADVDALPIKYNALLRLVGHSLLDRLLAELNANTRYPEDGARQKYSTTNGVSNAVQQETEGVEGGERQPSDESVWIPLSQVWQIGGSMLTPEDHNADFGINRVPRLVTPSGYQNQGTTVLIPTKR